MARRIRCTTYSTLQHTATHYSTTGPWHDAYVAQPTAHCNTLQHTATHCTTLQHTWPIARRIRSTTDMVRVVQSPLYLYVYKSMDIFIFTFIFQYIYRYTYIWWWYDSHTHTHTYTNVCSLTHKNSIPIMRLLIQLRQVTENSFQLVRYARLALALQVCVGSQKAGVRRLGCQKAQ